MVAYLPILFFALSSILGSNGLQSSSAEPTATENKTAPSCAVYHPQAVVALLNHTTGKYNYGEFCEGNDNSAVSVTCVDWQQPPDFRSTWEFTNYNESVFRRLKVVRNEGGGFSIKITIPVQQSVFESGIDIPPFSHSSHTHPQFVNHDSTKKYRLAEVHFDALQQQPSGDLFLFRQLVHESVDQPWEIAVIGSFMRLLRNETPEGYLTSMFSQQEKWQRWLTRPVFVPTVFIITEHSPKHYYAKTVWSRELFPFNEDDVFFYHYTPCSKRVTVRTNMAFPKEDGKGDRRRRSDVSGDLPMF